ncbi:MAG: single-strand binding protein/Primosomal replication protein n [Anaerocolumna sp.]|jgi:primosomal replication protein N|nr:single-strand binding protein/Primosomal replication protein n [Anaerocolumna sp.]
MTDKVFDNNQVSVAGEVVGDFVFSHDVFGEGFYILDVSVSRLSNSYDIIPIMVSERLTDVKTDLKGKFIEIMGQFRSYNRHEDNKNRLVLSVFAREIKVYEEDDDIEAVKPNHIFLDGFVCKQPIYRKTPLGREIADILLAVNRPYGKSDYIPCICWGRNARFAENFAVGGHIQVWGRIQSREYQKKIGENDYEKRVAFEVSVSKLEYLEEI